MGPSKRNTTSAAPKALSAKDVAAFLDYGYVPFSRAQCVRRIFIVLLSGAGLCLIGERSLLCGVAGMGLARVFLQGRSQQTAFAVITVGLLILSLMMGMTGSFLLKAWFCAWYTDK